MMHKAMNLRFITVFIARQRDHIREDGWPALRRKLIILFQIIIRLPLLLLELPFAFLIVLVVRLVRPFYVVRFGGLNSWRMGPFAAEIELYLCERDTGINAPKTNFVDVWYHLNPPCNKQLDLMWRRVLNIGPQHFLNLIVRINAFIPGGDIHRIGNNTQKDRDVRNLLDRTSPHLKFLLEEERRGQADLRALGIPPDMPFVCLIVRDSSYLKKSMPWKSWNYHDYRDCDIQNYILAAQELANRGYYVVRMGAVVKEAMNIVHPMIIDYATNGVRNDFMDIYLGAKCSFCISNGTGFDAVPYIFRRPIVYVDHVPLGLFNTFSSKFLAITKKHWLRDEGRFMTFREIVESGASHFCYSNQYEDMGIDLIESIPEEIAAVVLEMESRLKGTWQAADEDEVLQRRFWEMFPKGELHGEIRSRIGVEFLRQNKAWLE